MSNTDALRNMELPQGALEFIDAIEEEIDDLKAEARGAKDEATAWENKYDDAKGEIKELTDMLDDNKQYTVELTGGIIYCNIDGLDYFTKESFKVWVKEHAITNSEPLFNV